MMISHDWLPSITSISTRVWTSKDCEQFRAAKIHCSSKPIFFRCCMTLFALPMNSSLPASTSEKGCVHYGAVVYLSCFKEIWIEQLNNLLI